MFDVWKNALTEIEKNLDHSSFVTWFKGAKLIKIEGDVAIIGVPNIFKKTQIASRYKDLILSALNNNGARITDIVFEVLSTERKAEKPRMEMGVELTQSSATRSGGVEKISKADISSNLTRNLHNPNLNPRYTMDNFVIGSNNDLAVSVAKAVIEHPGEKYNPFFLYGGPGLGKTHLIQAIGNEILRRNPKFKVLYIPVSHFYSEFISMIQKGQGDAFAEKYRKLDVLIIDDFQFIVGKDRSQEEFFNIFNDLYQANKQIIVTSDRLPSQIKTLDERLSSRLAMAGAIDLQMPNFEDKCAILKSKAEYMGAEIEDEAIEYLAEEVRTNIRDLESEFSKILALSELRGLTPLQLIQDGYISTAPSGVRGKSASAKQVVEKIAKYYNLTVEEMCGKSRVSNIKSARQMAMFILSKELNMSTTKIAQEVGVKDHTTVMHGIKKIEGDIKKDFSLREQIEELKGKIYE